MAIIEIKIEGTEREFTAYAVGMGYEGTVVIDVNPDKTFVMGPNPQSATDYLTGKITGVVSTALVDKTVKNIEESKKTEARNESISARLAAESTIAVTIK